jgi:maltooligosyltrehalose trehalohydrolase
MDRSSVIPLDREPDGYFSGIADCAIAGMHYRYRLDHGGQLIPDPASRFQPEGPHGPSEIISPSSYRWKDDGWRGVWIEGQVIYEMHIGTFTQEGTWNAALEVLPELAETGITLLELMPVAEFPGRFGWGYDGVDLFAPSHLYGTPDEFRGFVDRAHSAGLGVILDVVYNHFGPDGNYLKEFSNDYLTTRHENEWGEAVNFDGPGSEFVREFFIANACYWIEEFHLDGLRLDATQQIFDNSPNHILCDISRETRRTAGQRPILLIAENEKQRASIIRRNAKGGYGLDAIWNDDFHHAAHVALTGHNEAYYSDYAGSPQELISATKWGFLYQGQYYTWQKQPRGTYALDLAAPGFVTYIENHDQVANSAYGTRAHDLTTFGRYKAITTLLLLGPGTPMLFQGQEYGASTPFLYFADHYPELAASVEKGRSEFLSQFPSIAHGNSAFLLGLPQDPATFERCKLNPGERRRKSHVLALFRDLLTLRREDPVFSAQRSERIHGAVLGHEAFALRFLGGSDGDRLILINLGRTLSLRPNPEPLLAPPGGGRWKMMWCSDDPKYRGPGCPALRTAGTWKLPGHSALVLGTDAN